MTTPPLSKALMTLFVRSFQLGTDTDAVADAGIVMQLISASRPDLPEVAAAEARLLMQGGDFAQAASLLKAAAERHPSHAFIKAMLAFCLFAEGDGLWQAYVDDVRRLPVRNETALAIVAQLERIGNNASEEEAPAKEPAAAEPPTFPIGLAC